MSFYQTDKPQDQTRTFLAWSIKPSGSHHTQDRGKFSFSNFNMGSFACAWIYASVQVYLKYNYTMVASQSLSASRTVSSSKRNGPDFFVELEPNVTHYKSLLKKKKKGMFC